MTTTTLSPDEIKAGFIAYLKADGDLVDAVGSEIREDQWQGDEFSFPAVRVGGGQYPVTPRTGNCFGQWFDVTVVVLVFTEGRSSSQCQQIMGLIGKRFLKAQLNTDRFRSLELRVNYIDPIAYTYHAWRGEVVVTGSIKEKV